MSRLPWILLGLALLGASVLGWRLRAAERGAVELQNQLARADTTRVIYRDSIRVVTERLAESRLGTVALEGVVGKIARTNKEQGVALQRMRLAFDSIVATTSGRVREDPTDIRTRLLSSELDTAGIHVALTAAVPPPPHVAVVHWLVELDTIPLLTTLTRTGSGQAVWRSQVEGTAKLLADSIVVAGEARRPRFLGLTLPSARSATLIGVPALVLGILLGKL